MIRKLSYNCSHCNQLLMTVLTDINTDQPYSSSLPTCSSSTTSNVTFDAPLSGLKAVAAEPCGPPNFSTVMAHTLLALISLIFIFYFACHHRGRSCRRQCWVHDQDQDQDQDRDQDPQLKIEIRISEIKISYVRDQDQDHETTLNYE